jgi:hypothetical protein
MILFKTDKKTGKKYKIVVPDWDIPVPIQGAMAPVGMGVNTNVVGARGNLFVNGGFETGDLSGWTILNAATSGIATGSGNVVEGTFASSFVKISTIAPLLLSQTISLPAFNTTLSFSYSGSSGAPFTVKFDNTTLLTTTTNGTWQSSSIDMSPYVNTTGSLLFNYGLSAAAALPFKLDGVLLA